MARATLPQCPSGEGLNDLRLSQPDLLHVVEGSPVVAAIVKLRGAR